VFQLLVDFFSGKAKTRIYTTFLGWLLIFHIDVIFIAALTDQTVLYDKTGLLKGEYVWAYISHFGLWSIALELLRFALAPLLTYLMIWILPQYINERSYREELEIEYTLRKMKVKKEEELNKREGVAVQRQLENIENEKKAVVERVKIKDSPETLKWDVEFKDFMKKINARDTLDELRNTVYAEGGNLFQYKAANGWTTEPSGVSPDNLALADINDLIAFTDKGKLISLTSKGKYFLRRA
jgi:hypothetical protein